MSNAGSIVLHRIISGDPLALEVWTKLSPEYFSADLRIIYKSIAKFYDDYNKLPSFSELQLYSRNAQAQDALVLLMSSNVPEDATLDIATDILVDEHVQNMALTGIEKLVTNITGYNAEEIIASISEVAYDIESRVKIASNIVTLDELNLFEEENSKTFIPLGLNNRMDSQITGALRGELLLLGGKRGHGKSLVCANMCVNEYLQGFVVPYYTIEMRAGQIYRRLAAIESEVDAMRLRSGTSSDEEKLKLAVNLVKKFEVDPNDFLNEFRTRNNDFLWLQESLRKRAKLRESNQMIIIDNPQLSLPDIDNSLQKLKARHGDKIRMVIVDYINQIKPSATTVDKFDWKEQVALASTLKAFAEKHDVIMVVPYQIDNSGEARFSKGILDSPDYAILLDANKDVDNPHMKFTTTKARDVPPFEVASKIDWGTLKISPEEVVITQKASSDSQEEGDSYAKKAGAVSDIAGSPFV